MKHNNKFIYPKCVRSNVDGKRVYDIDSGKFKLPSVTTILSATQSTEKRESLQAWRNRVGEDSNYYIAKRENRGCSANRGF